MNFFDNPVTKRVYKAFEPVSTTGYMIPLGSNNISDRLSDIYAEWELSSAFKRDICYRGVAGTSDNVWESILKMDHRPQMRIKHPDLFEKAKQVWRARWKTVFDGCGIDFNVSMTLDTSPTVPFGFYGFRNKRQVMMFNEFWKEWVFGFADKPVIWRVVSKHEFMELTLIWGGKIRTFIIPPLHLLVWQKVFFGQMSERMKAGRYHRVKYGQVFAHGGYHKMVSEFLSSSGFEWIIYGDDSVDIIDGVITNSDISGWDRRLPLMGEVYDLKREVLKKQVEELGLQQALDWTIDNTINSLLLLPNGDIIRKSWGNNSGSGQTTEDNCLAHDLIKEYISLIVHKKGSALTYDEYCSVYGEFDLIIKPSAFEQGVGAEKIVFLGAKCEIVEMEGFSYYIPSYKSDRIYSALTMEIKSHRPEDEIGKVYSLLFLSWNDVDLFDHLRKYLRFLIVQYHELDISKTITASGLPDFNTVVGFWCGLETSGSSFFESLGGLEDWLPIFLAGFKNS